MKKQENLISLIGSLSMSEKRYFKLFMIKNSKGDSNHYIKLFDLIDKTESTNREVIQKFYGNDIFMQKQFNVCKHRLYDQILNSMCAYHAEGSLDDKIMVLIRKMKVLYDKALFMQANIVLEKARNIATKYERHALLLEIARWHKKIIHTWTIQEEPDEEKAIQIYKEEKKLIEKIANANELWQLATMMFLSRRKYGVVRIQEDIHRNNTIMNHPLLKKEDHALSYIAKMAFNMAYIHYNMILNNLEEEYRYSKKCTVLMEAHPHQIAEEPVKYSNTLHILLSSCQSLKKYKEFFDIVPKLKSVFEKFKVPFSVQIHSYNTILRAYIYTGQFQKAQLFLLEIQPALNEQKYRNEMGELLFNANLALLHFVNKDYHHALVHINFVLNEKKDYLSPDHYSSMSIFQLIIHFDKGNTDLLPYLIKTFYKNLLHKKQLHKTENFFINFLRTRLNKMNTKSEQVESFKNLREDLLQLSNDEMEVNFLKQFDIISWLDSKIENRSFGEILREKSEYYLKEMDEF